MQHNYTASECKCLTIIHFINDWRNLFGEQNLIIYSNHKVLMPILDKCESINSHLMWWVLAIANMNFTIMYIKGSEMHSTLVCQFAQAHTTAEPSSLGQHPELSMPCKHVVIDFVGLIWAKWCKSLIYILSMVDCFSHISYAVQCMHNDTETATHKFIKFCYLHAFPQELLTDQGSHFTAEFMSNVMSLLTIKHHFTLPCNLHASGTVKKFNGMLN